MQRRPVSLKDANASSSAKFGGASLKASPSLKSARRRPTAKLRSADLKGANAKALAKFKSPTLKPTPRLRSADLHEANQKASDKFGGATLKEAPKLRSADLSAANEKALAKFGGAPLKPTPPLRSADLHGANESKIGRSADQQSSTGTEVDAAPSAPRAAQRGFGIRIAALHVSGARAVAAASQARFAAQQLSH